MQNIIEKLLASAKAKGADQADAIAIESTDLSVTCRLGKTENLERAESSAVGLRVLKGKKQAMVSSSDTSVPALEELTERAISMAALSPEDPHMSLASADLLAKDITTLDLFDATEPSVETLTKHAEIAEDAARAVPNVTNSEGADASYSKYRISLITSEGFSGSYEVSTHALSACVLAGEGLKMERDYDYATARHAGDLPAPETIGKKAGERTVKKLNPQKIPTCEVPVIFEPRMASSLLRNFASAVNGAAISRGSSFLKDSMGTQIFSKGIHIIDDPRRKRGLASKPFDGEGLATNKLHLVEDGTLQSWILSLRSANQLGLKSTGHASRGLSSAPSPSATNLYMQAGEASPEDIIKDIKEGLYLTNAFGMGINMVTGDYSQGASGFWIENGEITYPVSEITIASTLPEMFRSLVPANDLKFDYAINAPSLLIQSMTVAGS